MLVLGSRLGFAFMFPRRPYSRAVVGIGVFLVLLLWAVFHRVGLRRLRIWEYCMLCVSTMKNGNPHTAYSVKGRGGKVLPFCNTHILNLESLFLSLFYCCVFLNCNRLQGFVIDYKCLHQISNHSVCLRFVIFAFVIDYMRLVINYQWPMICGI